MGGGFEKVRQLKKDKKKPHNYNTATAVRKCCFRPLCLKTGDSTKKQEAASGGPERKGLQLAMEHIFTATLAGTERPLSRDGWQIHDGLLSNSEGQEVQAAHGICLHFSLVWFVTPLRPRDTQWRGEKEEKHPHLFP